MDLGLKGRNAIVLASSKGLGFACAKALVSEGVNVVINGRTANDVNAAAKQLTDAFDVTVTPVVADATTDAGRAALLKACPEPDILVLNGGGPPPTKFTDIDQSGWEATMHNQFVSPLMFVRDVVEGMAARKFGRIIAITSAMVKTPHPLMTLSHAPRIGLTTVLKAISRDYVEHNVTINQMLPERINTDRQKQMAQYLVDTKGITTEQAYAEIAASIAANRLGTPEEFGEACAFLCSANAGYICGQNLQLDGGSYEGVF
jgi:3-oxoacyl-[acyl-carrier protein] reductase